MAKQKTKRCQECDSAMSVRAKKCVTCGALQIPMKECRSCAKMIPRAARVCECGAYQHWWRRLLSIKVAGVLGVIIGLGAAIKVIVGWLPSKTEVQFAGTKGEVIYLHVTNKGGSPSALLDYVLEFGDIPIENARLELINAHADRGLIRPGDSVTVGLIARGLERRAAGVDEIERLLREKTAEVTLQVQVEESNKIKRVLPVRFPAAHVRELIDAKLPEKVD